MVSPIGELRPDIREPKEIRPPAVDARDPAPET